jgi:hypothetical protein
MQLTDYSILFPYTTDGFYQERIRIDQHCDHRPQEGYQILQKRKPWNSKTGMIYLMSATIILVFTCYCKPNQLACRDEVVCILLNQVLALSKSR